VDGSTLQLEHEPELMKAYHWEQSAWQGALAGDAGGGAARFRNGFSRAPYWGPLNGPHAVSEQALAERAMQHVPSGSVIVGTGISVFFFHVYSAQQRGLPWWCV